MKRVRGISTAVLVLILLAGPVTPAAAAPEGQVTWGIHISLAPTWFDRAETTGIVTPFMVMYALEPDRKRREAALHRIQQLVAEKAMFAPIYQFAAMGGHGSRVEESGLGLITGFPFSGPYEDVKLKAN